MLKSTASSSSSEESAENSYTKTMKSQGPKSAQEAALGSDRRGEKKGRESVEKGEGERETGKREKVAFARLRRGERRERERESVCAGVSVCVLT